MPYDLTDDFYVSLCGSVSPAAAALRVLLCITADADGCGGENKVAKILGDSVKQGALEVVRDLLQRPKPHISRGLTAFTRLSQHVSVNTILGSVVQAVDSGDMGVVASAISSVRALSGSADHWPSIRNSLPRISDLLVMERHLHDVSCDSTAVVVDAAAVIANMAVLEDHCQVVLDSGGVKALSELMLMPLTELPAMLAACRALCALAGSSPRCREGESFTGSCSPHWIMFTILHFIYSVHYQV